MRLALTGMGLRRFILVLALLGLLAAAAVALHTGYRIAQIGTAFAAESVCAGVFVSGRAPGAVQTEDLAAYRSMPLDLVEVEVDRDAGIVTGRLFGLAERRAVYREGLGCTLAIGTSAAELKRAARKLVPIARAAGAWPEGEGVTFERRPALERVLDEAFAERNPDRPKRTRAVVVVHRGRIVAERYAQGFGPDMALPGWSMSKSVCGALAGTLVGLGLWRLDAPLPLAAWQSAGDPRRAITLDDLLRMSSGLAFDETYRSALSDVNVMLWAAPDVGRYAAAKRLKYPPGTHWQYASGTTNLVVMAMRETLGAAYAAYPRRALFEPLGMASAVIAPDASGTYVGSSLMFATARDWARFGLLFANDGVWRGARLLPEDWVRYSGAPAPAAPAGAYGAHWWLKLERPPGAPPAPLPADAFHAGGHGGQYISIVPSQALVIVRLGPAVDKGAWDQEAFVARIISALGDAAPRP
jgi:CubicO group peptidase (beta-lactamase class C family)